jgi:PUA domain protein
LKSNLISKSETTALLKIISERWGIEFPKIKNVKVHQILDDAQIITASGMKILKVEDDY